MNPTTRSRTRADGRRSFMPSAPYQAHLDAGGCMAFVYQQGEGYVPCDARALPNYGHCRLHAEMCGDLSPDGAGFCNWVGEGIPIQTGEHAV